MRKVGKKIASITLVVLMLLTAIPLTGFGSLAVSAATTTFDFEDGTIQGWKNSDELRAVYESGNSGRYCLRWQTTRDWGTMYLYIDVTPNTTHTVSFRMKSSFSGPFRGGSMKANWTDMGWQVNTTSTTGWSNYSFTFNPGSDAQYVLIFQSNITADRAPVYFFDDISVSTSGSSSGSQTRPAGIQNGFTNGTFENGTTTGWSVNAATVSSSAAHTGRYGLRMTSTQAWASCAYQQFKTVPGQTYTLSFWARMQDTPWWYMQILDGTTWTSHERINIKSNEVGRGWKKYSITFTAPSTIAIIYSFCEVTGASLDVDDFVLTTGTTVSAPDTNAVEDIKDQLTDIQLGPYALKGAYVNVLGKEIPLINIEADIKLEFGKYAKFMTDKNGVITVMIGYAGGDDVMVDASSSTYWSESYKEVKALWQQVTFNQISSAKLRNRFNSMKSKLKKMDASLVVDVEAYMMGFFEFHPVNGTYKLAAGGVIASFEASKQFRHYYGPAYVALGVAVGADGKLRYMDHNFELSVSPKFELSVAAGVGGRKTYAELAGYGEMSAVISTNDDVPFSAGLDFGVRGTAKVLGAVVGEFKKSFASVQLYPDPGGKWPRTLTLDAMDVDLSSKSAYEDYINAAVPLSRDYLRAAYSAKSSAVFDGADFVKDNSFMLNAPQLVNFNNGTMLLVWVDDTGLKSHENLGTLMYSFYDGAAWSIPATLYEDGTYSDMPAVCSDGTTAYLVWQKATTVFDEGVEMSDRLPAFDLYYTSFRSSTQTFTTPLCLTPENDTAFEFMPTIDVSNGVVTVAWVENTDNNVYQMSGTNVVKKTTVNAAMNVGSTISLVATADTINDMDIANATVYYLLQSDESSVLYGYNNAQNKVVQENVVAFDCENGKVFYSCNAGFFAADAQGVTAYDGVGALQNFVVKSNGTDYVLFTEQVNEDFSKTLYYNKLNYGSYVWGGFEVYADRDKFIQDYSPVMLNNGDVYVAVNYTTDGDVQYGTLVVEQCTEAIDMALTYVDFDETLLREGAVDLLLGISNNSSSTIEAVNLYVFDEDGNLIDMQTVEGLVPGFSTAQLSTPFTLPADASDKVYTFEVYPAGYSELDESNNVTSNTFTCIHVFSDMLLVDVEATDTTSELLYYACDRCNAHSDYYACGENLVHTYDGVCDTSCNECGAVRESAPSSESVVDAEVLHSITTDEQTGNGLAFRFVMDIANVECTGNRYTSGTGTVSLHDEAHTVKRMGVILSNDPNSAMNLEHLDDKTINVDIQYLLESDEASVTFAARLINIPDENKDTDIYARPYYVYECNGDEVIVYGYVDTTTFQAEESNTNT